MALYQPTNVIPSSYTKGTIDVTDKMEISWEVNGNSAMTAFQIDFYLNDTASTYVTTTGRRTDNCPFYGTDRFGKPQFFTWNADKTWEDFTLLTTNKFTNGNEYKYKITQWYEGINNVVVNEVDVPIFVQGTVYYFKVPSGEYSNATVSFSAPSGITGNSRVYYSFTNGNGWIVNGNGAIVLVNMNLALNGTIPTGSTELKGNIFTQTLQELVVTQTSSNVFITRSKPTLTLYRSSTDTYTDKIPFPPTDGLATSIGYFVAKYEQEQDDPIRWIRWQVATANNGNIGDILQDTGDIYTPTLNFEFNGFFNGNQYAIRVAGESESGQTFTAQGADDEGWIFFNINIQNQGKYEGDFTVQCLNKENAALLQWDSVEIVPPTVNPQNYEPQISNGSVALNSGTSIQWDNKGKDSSGNEIPMSFEPEWTAVWKGKVETKKSDIENFEEVEKLNYIGIGYLLKYSPDGKYLLWYDIAHKYLQYYSVSESGATLIGYIISDGSITRTPVEFYGGSINDIDFNNNKNYLAVGTDNRIFLYSFINGTIKLLYAQSISAYNGVQSLAFSPDGDYLVAGGYENIASKIFSTANDTLTFLANLNLENESVLKTIALAVDFNYDGTLFAIGGYSNKYLYTFNNGIASFLQELPVDGSVLNFKFSRATNTDMLIVAGRKSYYHLKVNSEGAELVGVLSNLSDVYQGISRSIAFSPDGNYLVVGGTNYINYYKMGTNLHYVGKIETSQWNTAIAISWNPVIEQIAIHNDDVDDINNSFNQLIKPITFKTFYPQGKLFEFTTKQGQAEENFTLSANGNTLALTNGTTQLSTINCPAEATETAIVITPTRLNAYFYGTNGLISQSSTPITYTQQPITSVSIYGGDSGSTVDSVSIYNNEESTADIPSLYQDPNFEPVWNSDNYKLYMTANFNGNLEGGTGTVSGSGFRVYRQEVGKNNYLQPIATVNSTVTSLKDYGISSRKAYKYSLHAYDTNGAFMSAVEAPNVIATCFKNYSLLVCDYDYDKDEYHVRKQYLFALNLSNGSVGNNNGPSLNANFTRYPTRMPSPQNYASGTLSGLIGAIYTVPALIEQIGQFKHTVKPSTLDYFDSVDLEKELYDLSTSPYQLFLRDMKGRLRMVDTNGAITMTTNIKQKQQSISISFPWVETGDASDVTIIQMPDDYGWDNDSQLLDVSLDVDPTTGELSATYPYPYNGTKFYLTGVNKEQLASKTPNGITPAQITLSEVAEQPDDGEVNASVTINSENKG